jgi:hypothetical protein
MYEIRENEDGTFDVLKKGKDKPLNKEPYGDKKKAQAYMNTLEGGDGKNFKAGARHSTGDQKIVQSIHDQSVSLGADCGSEEEAAKGMKDFATSAVYFGMDAGQYAVQESWDVMTACNALCAVISLVSPERNEPDDLQKIVSISRGLIDFINSEISSIETAWDQAGQTSQMEGKNTKTPAILADKTALPVNLSYAKSIGSLASPKDIAVKFVGRDEIRAYLALWGGDGITDMESEYFTRETDFWDGTLGKSVRPLTWDHAQDEGFKASPTIGQIVDFGDDEVGRWYVARLDRHHRYRKAVDALIEKKSVGTSSDSAPQYVERVQTGKSTWLKTWPLFAAALTDIPCEPRMIGTVDYFKSIGVLLPSVETASSQNAHKIQILTAEFELLKLSQ